MISNGLVARTFLCFLSVGRITEDLLKTFTRGMSPSDIIAYVCGPPAMTDDVCSMLERMGVKGDGLRYEKWW